VTLGIGYYPFKRDFGPGVCKLPECSKPYTKHAVNQEYCNTVHQIRHANQQASERNRAETVKRRVTA
jgi:hypothetical protein